MDLGNFVDLAAEVLGHVPLAAIGDVVAWYSSVGALQVDALEWECRNHVVKRETT